MLKTLAAAIALRHTAEDGLRALYLPDQLAGLAREVVRSANARRPLEVPFAILVSDNLEEDLSDAASLTVGMGRSIQYRRDDRLAVVCGAHSVPASFSSSFGAAMDRDFPGEDGVARRSQMRVLAADVLEVVLDKGGVQRQFVDVGIAVDRLTNVFAVLAESYERLAQGADVWNVYWLRHVGEGLDALSETLLERATRGSAQSADALLDDITYAAFALPKPASGTAYGHGRKVDEALTEYWATADVIALTLERLRHHPTRPEDEQGEPHVLESLSFADFGQKVASKDNLLLAWGTPHEDVQAWVTAFASLSEGEFFAPQQGMDSALLIYAGTDHELGIAGEGSPQVVIFSWDQDDRVLRSEALRVIVPTSHIPSDAAVRNSNVSLKVTGSGTANASWVGTLVADAGELVAQGSVVIPRTGSLKMASKPVTLSTLVPPGDPLASCAGSAVSAGIYPIVEDTVGVWTFEAKGSNGSDYKPGTYRGYETIQDAHDDAGLEVSIESTVGTRVRAVAWGADPDSRFETVRIRCDQGGLSVSATDPDLLTTSEDELSVGHLVVRWSAGTSTDEFLSPLLAAARGGVVSAGEPDIEIQRSFRGRVETFLARSIDEASTLQAHGHIALFEDLPDLPDHLEAAADGAVLVAEGREDVLKSHIGFEVAAALRESPEAARFRDAIVGLGLVETLHGDRGAGGQADYVWPSRTSWASELREELLEEYLDSYSALVARAAGGTPQDLYWATFPFSVSVFATGGTKEARAVLLTPLHPLRLAWLATAEGALRDSTGAERLAGVLESWNLPVVGPQADSHNGRMLAIPTDAGAGQLFLGWSMLVSASVAGHKALDAPARIGTIPAPGTSVTGLNADAVRAALRTFHRMNPQVSTLTIDLASSTPSPRLDEIDEAIVAATASRSARNETLRGGVRVHDSMNRLGEAPLADLELQLGASPERPVRWSRYKHDQMEGPRANIRFLQDAGVKVEVSTTTRKGAGRMAAVPLRRFSTPVEAAPGFMAREFPAIEVDAGSTAFVRALAAVERVPSGVQISAELFRAALVNDSADWTVTGESLVGASALADMLAADGPDQMLWEWRPPFLDKRTTPQLDARPFVSVVRLPDAVKNQISLHVTKASGSADDLDTKVAQVMQTLGTRGIGLSSLMAQGGTHAAGAVGFFLTLRLLELAQVDGAELLILPIDACDEFLRGLANETASANQLRRADLLLIAVEDDGVTLVPVEIKCYGLGSVNPSSTLPSTSTQLSEALEQLESTAELLQQVVGSYSALASEASSAAALWRHGFATMVEAAMKLRPAPASGGDLLGETLEGLLSGDAPIRLGRSMLCYFGHGAVTSDGVSHELHLGLEAPVNPASPASGALVCNTQTAFDFVTDKSNDIGTDWQQLVEWVLLREPAPELATAPDVAVGPDPTEELTSETAVEPRQHLVPTRDDRGDVLNARGEPRHEASNESVGEGASDQPVHAIRGDGVRFAIGKTIDSVGSRDVEFWPSNTALTQMNVGVVGDLGTGKTQFLKSVVYQLRRGAAEAQATPISMLIFDYKRDYHDSEFLESVGGELQRPFHIPLNVLAIVGDYTPQKAVQAAAAFVDVITKIYGGIGPIQKSKVLMVIKDLFAEKNGIAPTLGEVLDAYVEANAFDSVAAVLNGFVLNEVFSEDPGELVTMEQMLDDKVLVLAVSDLGADDNLKTALITLFLNKYYEYMLRLTKWPFEGAAPAQLRRLNSFVLVDEATNIMEHEFPVLGQLLLQGREFGVGVILASQYVSHFKAGRTNYGETLLTKVIHKVPNSTANDLKGFGIPSATSAMASRIPTLAVHQALVETLGVEARFMRGTPYFELEHD